MLKKITYFVVFAALFTGCTMKKPELGSEENPVKLFFVPSVDAKLIADKAKLAVKYLEANTPYKFELKIPASFVAVVEAFGTNRADVAALNTFGYIKANEKYGAEAIITFKRFGRTTYRAQIVARADSDINELADINDKKFAYVDPASTSGYLLPAKLFKENNITPSETVFAKRHDNVIIMVYQKQVDAGATFHSPKNPEGKIEDARRLVLAQYPNVEEEIKIVQLTDEIPNDPMVVRKTLPDEMKKTIQKALLNYIDTEEGKDVFKSLYGVTEFVPATDKDYDEVRDMLKELGVSAADLMKK